MSKELYSDVDSFWFEIDDNKSSVTITRFLSNEEVNVSIPSIIQGLPVTRIGDRAFTYKNVTSVVIPDSVTTIGEEAFSYCGNLISVVIPDSVARISEGAFFECSKLTSATIPAGVIRIDNHAFASCFALAALALPDSINSICAGAFEHCYGLTSVVLPDSLATIDETAFDECRNLKSVVIVTQQGDKEEQWHLSKDKCNLREYLRYWDDGCFSSLSFASKSYRAICRLTSNRKLAPEQRETYATYVMGQSKRCAELFVGTSDFIALRELAALGCLPDRQAMADLIAMAQRQGQSEIAAFLLEASKALQFNSEPRSKIVNPLSVAELKKTWSLQRNEDGAYTIKGYKGEDTHITIPQSIGDAPVTSIAEDAFNPNKEGMRKKAREVCGKLISVVIPEGVALIGDRAFSKCSSLASVVIPESLTEIGMLVFNECTNLKGLTLAPDGGKRLSVLDGVVFDGNLSALLRYPPGRGGSYVVPDGVTSISSNAFDGSHSLRSIVIPDSVTSIGDGAFMQCRSLTSVIIPDSVTSIGKDAFYGCKILSSLSLPKGITEIGDETFFDCQKINSLIIPEGVSRIGNQAFWGCYELSTVVIPESVRCIAKDAFERCFKLVIQGAKGSVAESYALEQGIVFEELREISASLN